MRINVNIIGYFIGIMLLAGCSRVSNNLPEDDVIAIQALPTPTILAQSISPSPLPSSTAVASATMEVAPTVTPTILPTLSLENSTPTPFPTFDVAVSTLSKEVATQNLIELLETNRGCELPCWWGIMPGETNVDNIESIFVNLGFDWYRDYEELEDNTLYKASIYFVSEEGKIQSIEVRGGAGEETYDRNEAWRPYAIPRVLERLGVPENVYVYYPFRFDSGGMQAYRMFLYYPDLGVEIDYLGKATLIDNRPGWAQACHNILETDDINLFLFQPGTVPDYLELTMPESSLPLPKLEGDPYDWVSWEQATESSLAEFEQLFTETNAENACFEFKTYWTDN